jgi:hypothetical protein
VRAGRKVYEREIGFFKESKSATEPGVDGFLLWRAVRQLGVRYQMRAVLFSIEVLQKELGILLALLLEV